MCDLADEMQKATSETLGGAAASGGRRQLSEEAVTHKLLDLVDASGRIGRPVWIRDFGRASEGANGADLELWFWERGSDLATGWLVQAKRLSPPETPGSSPKFNELAHRVRGRLQSDLLITAAAKVAGLMPVYWLYSWDFSTRRPCLGKMKCKCTPTNFDDALLVTHASTVASTLGSSWHNVVIANGLAVESLRRLWCHSSNSVVGLGLMMRDLMLAASADNRVDNRAWFVTGLPPYVSALVHSEEYVELTGRGTTAQRLVLIEL